jgi:AcrR family transcriptional regulator
MAPKIETKKLLKRAVNHLNHAKKHPSARAASVVSGRAPAKKNKSTEASPAAAEPNLRDRLIAAAARCIEESGLAGIKARELATHAGCSPGMIYYVFADLDALVLALNHETRNRLDDALQRVLVDDPRDNLERLALGYLRFAHANKQLWRALFEFRIHNGKPAPEAYETDIMVTFSRITQMLTALFPDREPAELELSSRALFSAVHGIVALGLDENYVAVPLAQLQDRLCRFVATFMIGMQHEVTSGKRLANKPLQDS